jgi:hypothetical protein
VYATRRGTMTDETAESQEPMSPGKRAIYGVVGLLAVALLVFVAVHVMITPIAPDQKTPLGHFGPPCALCHIVSKGTAITDVGN